MIPGDSGAAFHLPLIDLALPAIKSAPAATKEQLVAALEVVINADRRVSLHEFVVLTLVASVAGLAIGWALRGPARWCPGCGAGLVCPDCQVPQR